MRYLEHINGDLPANVPLNAGRYCRHVDGILIPQFPSLWPEFSTTIEGGEGGFFSGHATWGGNFGSAHSWTGLKARILISCLLLLPGCTFIIRFVQGGIFAVLQSLLQLLPTSIVHL